MPVAASRISAASASPTAKAAATRPAQQGDREDHVAGAARGAFHQAENEAERDETHSVLRNEQRVEDAADARRRCP